MRNGLGSQISSLSPIVVSFVATVTSRSIRKFPPIPEEALALPADDGKIVLREQTRKRGEGAGERRDETRQDTGKPPDRENGHRDDRRQATRCFGESVYFQLDRMRKKLPGSCLKNIRQWIVDLTRADEGEQC